MNTTALRALVLLVNLSLWSLVSWMSYETFRYVDQDHWKIDVPDFSRFVPPLLEEDPLAGEREVYNTISDVFALPVEALAPVEKKAPPPPPPPANAADAAKRLQVVMSNVAAAGGEMHSTVMLRPPGVATEKPFTEGMALDSYKEFAAFKGVTVHKITPEAIVLVDESGKEVARLDARPKEGGR